MRLIGNIKNDVDARVFGDFLYVRQIENQIERDPDGTYAVWIIDDDRLEDAKQLLQQFQQNPADPEYRRVGGSADEKRRAVQIEEERARRRIVNSRQIFPRTRGFRVGPITFTLIAICVFVAIRSKLGGDGLKDAEKMAALGPIMDLFIADLHLRAQPFLADVRNGEIWRLFTPMLIHFGPMHILGNMMWLLYLGSMIEDRDGSGYFAVMVLVISSASNVIQLLWSASPFFGGMSGVVYGLFGYVFIRSKVDFVSEYFIDRRDVILSVVWLFLCTTELIGPIANAAHFGGLFIGLGWGYVDALLSRRRQ